MRSEPGRAPETVDCGGLHHPFPSPKSIGKGWGGKPSPFPVNLLGGPEVRYKYTSHPWFCDDTRPSRAHGRPREPRERIRFNEHRASHVRGHFVLLGSADKKIKIKLGLGQPRFGERQGPFTPPPPQHRRFPAWLGPYLKIRSEPLGGCIFRALKALKSLCTFSVAFEGLYRP